MAKTITFTKSPLLLLATLLSIAVALVGSLSSVSAASVSTSAPTSAQLERAFIAANAALAQQARTLTAAARGVATAGAFIDTLTTAGYDTTALRAALDRFSQRLNEAQRSHNDASATLKAHAGFDSAGKVTDAAAAQETLNKAATSLQQATSILSGAAAELAKAAQDFRAANPLAPVFTVPGA